MSEVFVISDHHLGHANILTFLRQDGSRLREFSSLDEMHQVIVTRHNSVVGKNDKTYFLGDVGWGKSLPLLNDMNGRKVLIRGNHDLENTSKYLKHFKEVYGVRQLNGIWLTHIPMHETCVTSAKVVCNIHGHIHDRVIDHPKYVNVCVEQVAYTPVNLQQIRGRFL